MTLLDKNNAATLDNAARARKIVDKINLCVRWGAHRAALRKDVSRCYRDHQPFPAYTSRRQPLPAYGRREDDEGGSIVFRLFSRAEVEAYCEDELGTSADLDAMMDAAIEMSGFFDHWGGPGRSFGAHPTVKLGRNRVLVTQFRGLDI